MMFPNLPHPHTMFRRVMAAIAGVITHKRSGERAYITAARNEMIDALLDLEDRIAQREHAIMTEIKRLDDARASGQRFPEPFLVRLKAGSERDAISQLLKLARQINRIEHDR
jgi:hypothetical protein